MEQITVGAALVALICGCWLAFRHPRAYWLLARVALALGAAALAGLAAYALGYRDALLSAGIRLQDVPLPDLNGIALMIGTAMLIVAILTMLPHWLEWIAQHPGQEDD